MPIELAFGHVPSEPFADHVRLMGLAEELGFSTTWIADQTLFRDPYALLAVAAQATETIELGIGVTNPYTRHPAMTARAIASVSELAGGRVLLGIGAGNRRELLDPLGLPSDAVARRIHEMVVIIRELLTTETVSFAGEHYRVEGIGLDFTPIHPVPIYIGGRGERVLQTAGEVADGAIIGGLCTASGITYAVEAVTTGATKAGRPVEDIKLVSWVTCVLTDDGPSARTALRPTIAHIIGGAPLSLFDYLDIPGDVITRLKERYAEGGKEAAASEVTDDCIDAFAIVGSAEECSERILALEAAGIDQLSVLMSRGTTTDHEQRLRAIAADVAPRLRHGGDA